MPFPSLNPLLAEALAARGYEDPTPVQAAVLAEEARDRDLLVSAQTGSGKTVAFGLALGDMLIAEAGEREPGAAPRALVIAPTRELALQVHRELGWLYAAARVRVVSCVGGMDPRAERRALQAGADIVVGTPGRLRDHLERGALDVSALAAIVLDEADEMLDLGFREDLAFILEAAPAERRTLLFSATIPKPIADLARTYQRDAWRIDTIDRGRAHADIAYHAVRVAPGEVEHAVVNVLRFVEARGAMVFCATREAVKRLHGSLLERGFAAVALSGELTQAERANALMSLRDGRARVCVATDVAARGIDLPDLGLVVHADLPNDAETLLHRSGRTGRAGRKGMCVLVVPVNRRRKAEALIRTARIDPEWSGPPTPEEIRERDDARFLADPVIAEEPSPEERETARALLESRDPEAVAAALVRLWRTRLPAPEEALDPGDRPRRERDRDRDYVREERVPREGGRGRGDGPTDFVWFELNVGRADNADPKWLLPLICRLGHVTRDEVGPIRIEMDRTRVGISREHAERFARAARRENDEGVAVRPAEGPPGPRSPGGARPGAKPGRPSFKRKEGAPGEKRPHRKGPRPPERSGAPSKASR